MPSQMTPAAARVVDAVISTAIRGYRQSGLVGTEALFPTVPVMKRGGNRIEFGKEDFKQVNTRRAPGARMAEVQFGHVGKPFALEDHSLAGKVPIELVEESANTPAANQVARAARSVMRIMNLSLENDQAVLATTAANYPTANKVTLSGTDQWSDAGSDPANDVETAKDAIRAAIGLRPNTMVIGDAVLRHLRRHADIIEAVKYSAFGVPNFDQLRAFFQIERLFVAGAVTADAADTFSDVWGKHVILAYVAPPSSADMGEPSYGYTYQLEGYPTASQQWWDDDTRSWKTAVSDARAPEIVGSDAGYLITDAVA